MEHVNRLCLTVLQTSGNSTSAQLAVLAFYEQMAVAVSRREVRKNFVVVIPSSLAIYMLAFSQSSAVVSQLCAFLASYKKALDPAVNQNSGRENSNADRAAVETFSGFLMDICNCLWRGRAFSYKDQNAAGCHMPPAAIKSLTAYISSLDEDLSLTALFDLSHSPALCLQAMYCLQELEDAHDAGELRRRHAGPVSKKSLSQLATNGGLNLKWQEYRLGVLQYLEENAQPGVSELMVNTVASLKALREA